MTNWQWPQVFIVALLVIGLIWTIVKTIKDRQITSEHATWNIIVWIAYYMFYAYVLHAGGFW